MGGGARLVEADAAKSDAKAKTEAWALLREIATAAIASIMTFFIADYIL